jgi:hypothetical protein
VPLDTRPTRERAECLLSVISFWLIEDLGESVVRQMIKHLINSNDMFVEGNVVHRHVCPVSELSETGSRERTDLPGP